MTTVASAGSSEHLQLTLSPPSELSPQPRSASPLPSPVVTVDSSFRLYRRRYFVLFVFSSLAFLNNVVCYSFASISAIAHAEYPSISLSSLVSLFFLTYAVFSIPSSLFIERFGLRSGVVLGAWLQAIGCYLRWADRGGPVYDSGLICWLRVGQLTASLGQAFFVNPPAMMAAQWFGNDQRVLATTIAVNANTLGIAGAYVLGSLMVRSASDIDGYLFLILALSIVLALLASVFFPSAPPTPPSFSEHHQHKQSAARPRRNPFSPRSVLQLFSRSGFLHTCLAFAVAEAIINALSAFMSDILSPRGYSPLFVGCNAVSFILQCMIGSAIVGFLVDRTRTYLLSVCLCFLAAAAALLCLTYSSRPWSTALAVAVLGFSLGPVQPLVIEVAVECTYPSSSSTVAAVQQLLGNVVSALLFPLMAWMKGKDDGGMDEMLLAISLVLALSAAVYSSFRGEYRRLRHETLGVLERRDSENSEAGLTQARPSAAADCKLVRQLTDEETEALLLGRAGNGGLQRSDGQTYGSLA